MNVGIRIFFECGTQSFNDYNTQWALEVLGIVGLSYVGP